MTTSTFTTPAEEWVSEHGVHLVDGADFADKLCEMEDGYDFIGAYTDTTPESVEKVDEDVYDFGLKTTLLLGSALAGVLLIITAVTFDSSMMVRLGFGLLGIILAISLPMWMAWATYNYKQKKRELEALKREQ